LHHQCCHGTIIEYDTIIICCKNTLKMSKSQELRAEREQRMKRRFTELWSEGFRTDIIYDMMEREFLLSRQTIKGIISPTSELKNPVIV